MDDIRQFAPLWGCWYPERILGRGAYGVVWLVSDMEKLNYAAVKHISIPQDGDGQHTQGYIDRFMQSVSDEIDIMDRLRGNAHIVSYEDYLILPKRAMPGYDILIRMKLLTPCMEHFRREGGIERSEVIQLGMDICDAMSALNSKGIVHRDIKQENIMLNAYGEYMLGDFGTARLLQSGVYPAKAIGTYGYMAPELYNGEKADAAADIYSLGMVLYRLMNGNRAPFLSADATEVSAEENDAALMRRMAGETLPPPRYADPELARVILKACAYRPEDRYRTAQELGAALHAVSGGRAALRMQPGRQEPIMARAIRGIKAHVFPGIKAHASRGMLRKAPLGDFDPEQTLQETEADTGMLYREGDNVTLGSYAGDPIEWQVLDEQEGVYTLISVKLLEHVRFNREAGDGNAWDTAHIREWLNETFYNVAFSEEEKAHIVTVTNDTKGCGPTEDRVWLLSSDEVKGYFADRSERVSALTEHARESGAGMRVGCGWWWLRSPGITPFDAEIVDREGDIHSVCFNVAETLSVRPVVAFRLF